MKKRFLYPGTVLLFLTLVLGLAYAAVQTPVGVAAAANPEIIGQPTRNVNRLEGAWRVQVTGRNCQTGAEVRTFPSLLTFARGGTLVETTTGGNPALRGPGQGFWQHTSGHEYNAVFEAFLFDPAGAWTGRQKVTQTITIGDDRDQFSANAVVEFFDTNGNPTTSGCSTAVGQRMVN